MKANLQSPISLPKSFLYLCRINFSETHIETSLEQIAAQAEQKTAENDRFRVFLKAGNGEQLDQMVQELDKRISPLVDCTACGNCCKSLMIVVTDEEADQLATHLGQDRKEFDAAYLEKGGHELMVINRIPCHFLADNKCTVYEHRFAGCREFPALHVPDFRRRLFTTFMHYDRCPIIFNVMEQLKTELGFYSDNSSAEHLP